MDGNRRLGWLATAVFLSLNGVNMTRATNDDVHALVLDGSAGQRSIEDIAHGLQRILG